MSQQNHIPYLKTISEFYKQLQIGTPQGDDFSIMKIENQPATKRLEMPLFRCNFYRMVFIKNKGVEWVLPESQFNSTENCIYFAYPGKLESWLTKQKIHGYLVCFTPSFVESAQFLELEYPYFAFETSQLLHLNKEEALLLATQQEEMLSEMDNGLTDSKEMLQVLLKRYLISVRRLFVNQDNTLTENKRNDYLIFQRFKKELDDYFSDLAADRLSTQPNVSTIAERLFLNASYLNTIIKGVSGKTSSTIIQEKTLLEAKSYLMHTNLQVTEVAFKLGFTNVSYFNRFFKKWTDLSPSAFRKSIEVV
ncbi:MAG: AraC family transcriptional regulator [Bacteroidota bacterium]